MFSLQHGSISDISKLWIQLNLLRHGIHRRPNIFNPGQILFQWQKEFRPGCGLISKDRK